MEYADWKSRADSTPDDCDTVVALALRPPSMAMNSGLVSAGISGDVFLRIHEKKKGQSAFLTAGRAKVFLILTKFLKKMGRSGSFR